LHKEKKDKARIKERGWVTLAVGSDEGFVCGGNSNDCKKIVGFFLYSCPMLLMYELFRWL